MAEDKKEEDKPSGNHIVDGLKVIVNSPITQDLLGPAAKKAGKIIEFPLAVVHSGLLKTKLRNWALRVELQSDEEESKLRNRFQPMIAALSEIPEDQRQIPSGRIAAESIDAMILTNDEEEDIRYMFTQLLVAASDKSKSNKILPSFSKILSEISSDEAVMLKEFSNGKSVISWDVFLIYEEGWGKNHEAVLCSNYLDDEILSGDSTVERESVCIQNLVRLGLVDKSEFPARYETSHRGVIREADYYSKPEMKHRLKDFLDGVKFEMPDEGDSRLAFHNFRLVFLSLSSLGKSICKICIPGERPDVVFNVQKPDPARGLADAVNKSLEERDWVEALRFRSIG
jgi:hypothetical protein